MIVHHLMPLFGLIIAGLIVWLAIYLGIQRPARRLARSGPPRREPTPDRPAPRDHVEPGAH